MPLHDSGLLTRMKRLAPAEAPYGIPLKMEIPSVTYPRILPAAVATTGFELVTLPAIWVATARFSHGASAIVEPATEKCRKSRRPIMGSSLVFVTEAVAKTHSPHSRFSITQCRCGNEIG